MSFNQVFRVPPATHIELTNFKISSFQTELFLVDTIAVGESAIVIPPLILFDSIAVGEAAVSTNFPINAIANRISPDRGLTRASALRGETRIQPLYQKTEEYDNKIRQSTERIPE